MLIDFRTLFPMFSIKPSGVLHIGANIGEEFPVYMELGITKQIWFEPNPKLYKVLSDKVVVNDTIITIESCVGDENKDVVLHLSNNAGQSSSILDLGTHAIVHPDVHYVEDITVPMVRLDTYHSEGFDRLIKDVDFLNVDVQGAELKVLKGMGNMLHQFKWAYLEVNKAELYKGCALVEEIDDYLFNFGFSRAMTTWAGNTNWGDALYIKIKDSSIYRHLK